MRLSDFVTEIGLLLQISARRVGTTESPILLLISHNVLQFAWLCKVFRWEYIIYFINVKTQASEKESN